MAIDTTGKKLSLINYMRVDKIILPEGDGSFNEADKLHFLNLYSFAAEGAGGCRILLANRDSSPNIGDGICWELGPFS